MPTKERLIEQYRKMLMSEGEFHTKLCVYCGLSPQEALNIVEEEFVRAQGKKMPRKRMLTMKGV